MNDSEDEYELNDYREELKKLLHKSQDTFEKQLSYISAGALVLSIGFIKDVIKKDINLSSMRWSLTLGWIFLAVTLVLNLFSHLWAGHLYLTTISEIDEKKFEGKKSETRFNQIAILNWGNLITLVVGIVLIIFFIYSNI